MGSGLEDLGIVDDQDQDQDQASDAASRRASEVRVRESSGAHPTSPSREVVLQSLQQIALFEGVLPQHLLRMAALAREVRVERGKHIFEHGDDGDGLYLIMEGAVRISRNVAGIGEEALAVLKPGMYFGEMSIVDDSPRSADAIAHESCRLIKLGKDDLRDLMFVDRELAYELLWRFVRTLSGRLRESNDRLMMLTVSSRF